MAKLTPATMERLKAMGQAGLNILLTGAHGIGKTTMFYDLCDSLGLKGAYINVPSADYFVDWLGIPNPQVEPEHIRTVRWFLSYEGGEALAASFVQSTMSLEATVAMDVVHFVKAQKEQASLQFLRPKRLEGVEFVFFDEINREADPRFLDACMEMVQFNQVNGKKLPDLKLVWAAQNPPNDIYRVKELDVPLVDKFGAHIFLEGCPDYNWYCSKGYSPHTVAAVISWYDSDLNKEQKSQISPRTLENIMRLVDGGIDPEFGLLSVMQIPAHMLKAKLARCSSSHRYANYDLPSISADPVTCIEYAKSDLDFCAFYTDLLRKEGVQPHTVLKTVAVFLAMPFEFQSKCFTDNAWTTRINAAISNGANLPADVVGTPGFQNFVEMLRQFSP